MFYVIAKVILARAKGKIVYIYMLDYPNTNTGKLFTLVRINCMGVDRLYSVIHGISVIATQFYDVKMLQLILSRCTLFKHHIRGAMHACRGSIPTVTLDGFCMLILDSLHVYTDPRTTPPIVTIQLAGSRMNRADIIHVWANQGMPVIPIWAARMCMG